MNVEWLAAAKQGRLAQGDKDDNRIRRGHPRMECFQYQRQLQLEIYYR